MRAMPDVKRRKATIEEQDAIEITLDWLMARVKEDDNGCWVWQGCIAAHGQPQARITVSPKVTATMMVRRLIAKMKLLGEQVPDRRAHGVNAYLRNKLCGVKRDCSYGCCHPDHVVARTPRQTGDLQRGKKLPLEHRLKITKARRAASKISDDDVMEILMSNEPGPVVAKRLGVSPTYPASIRSGRYRSLSTGMFAGLGGSQ